MNSLVCYIGHKIRCKGTKNFSHMQARVHFYYVFVGILPKIVLLSADFFVSARKKRNLFA